MGIFHLGNSKFISLNDGAEVATFFGSREREKLVLCHMLERGETLSPCRRERGG